MRMAFHDSRCEKFKILLSSGIPLAKDSPQRWAIERPVRGEETTKNGNVARPPGTCVRGHGRSVQKRHDRDIPWTCRELNISVMS